MGTNGVDLTHTSIIGPSNLNCLVPGSVNVRVCVHRHDEPAPVVSCDNAGPGLVSLSYSRAGGIVLWW